MADVSVSDLLICAMQVIGRTVMTPAKVGEIVFVNGNARQLKAYNLCDGTKTQTDVAKEAGLDTGNFSRTANRWVESGVLFKLGNSKEAKLLHLYPLATGDINAARKLNTERHKKKRSTVRKGRRARKRTPGRASR